jgi:hypothetical protein
MSIIVYWVTREDVFGDGTSVFVPDCEEFTDGELGLASAKCSELRATEGVSHITMCSEFEGQVGTKDPGGIVEDGKLPDGSDYTWRKRR